MVLGRMFVEETFNNKSKIEVGISLCSNRLKVRLKLYVIGWPISGSYKGLGRILLVKTDHSKLNTECGYNSAILEHKYI